MTDESAGKSSEHAHMTAFAPFEAEKSTKLAYKRNEDQDNDRSKALQASDKIVIQDENTDPPSSSRVFFKKLRPSVTAESSRGPSVSQNSRSGVSSNPPAKQTLFFSRLSASKPSSRAESFSVSYNAPDKKAENPSLTMKVAGSHDTTRHAQKEQLSASVIVGGRPVTHVDDTQEDKWGADPQISLLSYSDVRKGQVHSRAAVGVGKSVPPQQWQLQPPSRKPVNRVEVVTRIGIIEKHQESSSDLKKYWMPDKACKECSECGVKFNILVRKHHCRICGRIFCNSCCSCTIPGALLRPDLQGQLRVCKECLDIFNDYASKKTEQSFQVGEIQSSGSSPLTVRANTSSPNLEAPPTSSESNPIRAGSGNFSRAISQRPVNILTPHKTWDDTSSSRSQEMMDVSPRTSVLEIDNLYSSPRKSLSGGRRESNFDSVHSVGPRDERLMALDEDEVEFIVSAVWYRFMEPSTRLQPQTHRLRLGLRNFPNTYSAHDIVVWLLSNKLARSREVALRVGQALVDSKRLNIVSSPDPVFRDDTTLFLELGKAAYHQPENPENPVVLDAPKWFQHLPQDRDSEHPYSSSDSSTAFFRKNRSAEPTVTISSLSDLDMTEAATKHFEMEGESEEEYLVIEKDYKSDQNRDSSLPSSLSKDTEMPSFPVTPEKSDQPSHSTPSTKYSPHATRKYSTGNDRTHSYTLLDSRELLTTVPVQHLRSATRSVDQDDANQSMISATDAKMHFETEHDKHFDNIMIQLIMTLGLDLSWLQVIKPLIIEATNNVQTNVFEDDVMDINQYVKVKKVPGGHKSNSSLVYGVVCTKNVTHKKMQCSVKNPSILLLRCAFDFQRRENQLSSFDTLHLQEEKYLKNRVARVKTLDPSIVLVQNSVSRLALEMLYELGIVVVVNVRLSVMNRIARCTKGTILNSLDQLFFDVHLGKCGHFYTRDFSLPDGVKKTLMYFDRCEPRLGCVITLHGGSNRKLKRVKKLTQFGLHIAHNSRLETSFLVDEFAWPSPSALCPKPEPSVEDYSSSPSTPEWPLFPALAHPLDSLSPAELVEKLQALGITSSGADSETPQRKLSDDTSLSAVSIGEVPTNQDEENSTQTDTTYATKENLPSMIKPTVTQGVAQPPSTSEDTIRSDSDTTLYNVQGQQTVATVEPPTLSAVNTERDDTGLLMTISETASLTESQIDDGKYDGDNAVKATQAVKAVSQDVLARLPEKEFQMASDSQVLSISPNVQLNIPYLQTAQGREADVRQYLPKEIYWSYQFRKKEFQQKMLKSLEMHGYLEAGITRDLQLCNGEMEHSIQSEFQHSTASQRSYKSVSDHPLTKSIFLLKANSNEMKAALADYRARAGQMEERDSFFFPSAQKASNYHLQLQNVFNKYKQFEEAADSMEESTSLENSTEEMAKRGPTTKTRGQFWRKAHKKGMPKTKQSKQKLVTVSDRAQIELSSGQSQQANEEEGSEIRAEDAKAATEPTVKESHALSDAEMTDSGSRSRQEKSSERSFSSTGSAKEASDSSHKTTPSKNKDSSGLRLSAGVLEDIDKSPAKNTREGEEDANTDMDMNYDMWMANDTHADCLDPYNHQAISILFSNTCHDGQKHQVPCVPPCIIRMFYYGQNDISLGEFLQRYCFRDHYMCQSCGVDMSKHQRHIVHNSTGIHIMMQQLDGTLADNDNGIYTWLACKHCSQCTPPTLMSSTSLLFSFAKFLELKFHCSSYITRYESNDTNAGCTHLLHSDYVQYFCHKNKIAAFQPSSISILEVLLPPRDLVITTPHDKYHLNYVSDIKVVQRIMEGVFYRISQKLLKYNMEPVTSLVTEHVANYKVEREALRIKGNSLKTLVVSAGFLTSGISTDAQDKFTKQEKDDEMVSTLLDGLEDFKRSVSDVVECWNIHLEDLDSRVRDYRRKMREANISPYTVEGPSKSPRDSPVSTALAAGNSSHNVSREFSSKEDHSPTPTSASTFRSSPSMKRDSTESSSQSQNQFLCAQSEVKNSHSHSRNLSDGSYEKTKKAHQRKLSDSNAMQVSQKENTADGGEDTKRDTAASEHTGVLSGTTSTDTSTKESLEDPLAATSTIATSEGELSSGGEKSNSASSKDDISSPTESAYLLPNEEGTHTTDNSGGLFAKFRDFGRDDAREDTSKFYLLDQNEIMHATGSPRVSRASNANPSDPTPPTRVYQKRPGTVPRKSITSAVVTPEGTSEGKGERRTKKENGVLSRPFQRLPPPFEPTEHHTMSKHLTIPVAIYEKEPTSIIAFALSSREYAKELNTLMERVVMKRFASAPSGVSEVKPALSTSPKAKRRGNDPEKAHISHTGSTLKSQAALNFKAALHELKKKSSAISLFSGLTMSNTSGASDAAESKTDPFTRSYEHKLESSSSSYKSREGNQFSKSGDATLEGGLHPNASVGGQMDDVDARKTTGHISLEFTTPDKSANFFCKVYFAEEFHKLRERIFPSGEERYIRSLARCVKYDAKGGKSRSAFCKVADDRFILKQIKSIEISAFEEFAKHYLEHVTKALEEKRPLTLAKILGAYSIGFKNSKTGNSKRLDVLVMENLLYGHSAAKVFDLKGSMRSRYIDPSKDASSDAQSVLLDENYLNYICSNPVYVHPHSKFVLMQAVLADSEFLARNSIMDYSLLTCIDESSRELVVGIIDYVRTFTLDKWFEMKVKKTAGRTLPTVVYPELYRKRFCDAIERYFTPVPDKWTGLGSGIGLLAA